MYLWELFTNWTYTTPSREGLLNVAAFILALLIAIILHELAHGYVAYAFGDDTAKVMGRLSFNPLRHIDWIGFLLMLLVGFGWAKPVPVNPNNFKKKQAGMICVSLAGVVTNLLLSFVFSALLVLVEANYTSLVHSNYYLAYFLYIFLYMVTVFNITFALFNILPLYPLDGYRLLSCFLPQENGFMRFLRKYSLYIMIALMLVGYIPVVQRYSPLSLYIGYGRAGILGGFQWLWRTVFGV